MDKIRVEQICNRLERLRQPQGKRGDLWLVEISEVLSIVLPKDSAIAQRFHSIQKEVNKDNLEWYQSENNVSKLLPDINSIIDSTIFYLRTLPSEHSELDVLVRSSFQDQFFKSWPYYSMIIILLISFGVTFGGSFLNYVDFSNTRKVFADARKEIDIELNNIRDKLDKSVNLAVQDINRNINEKTEDIRRQDVELRNFFERIRTELTAVAGEDSDVRKVVNRLAQEMVRVEGRILELDSEVDGAKKSINDSLQEKIADLTPITFI